MCLLLRKKQLPNDASFGNSPKALLSATQAQNRNSALNASSLLTQ
jgi:hypothetical protein